MTKPKSIAISLIVISLVLVGGGVWFFRSLNLSQKMTEQSDLVLLNKIKNSATKNISDFLEADTAEKSIAKDLFAGSQYQELKETPVEINTINIGNNHPFAPLNYTFEKP